MSSINVKRNPLLDKVLMMQQVTYQKQVQTLLHFQEKIHRRIKLYAEFGHKECRFCVPDVEVGMPLYDAPWIRSKLVKMLRKDGFLASLDETFHIVVQWPIEILGPPTKTPKESKKKKKKYKDKDRSDRKIEIKLND